MNRQFLESVFSDSVQHPNFFNGRILTATDLREEQKANQKRSRHVAQAIGSGVAYGLTVSATTDNQQLSVSGGLAINLRGDTLSLPEGTTEIPLSAKSRAALPQDSPFAPCDLAGQAMETGNIDTNYYLLAITRANRLSPQLAPHSGLDSSQNSCTSRYEEVGVQFRLIPIVNKALLEAKSAMGRSVLAHLCFGTKTLLDKLADPLGLPTEYGLEDGLRLEGKAGEAGGLSDCDVPLAVFHYQNNRIQFVDMWAVRRLCQPGVRSHAYPIEAVVNLRSDRFKSLASPRRLSEATAFFLQFQAQLTALQQANSYNNRQALSAATYFEYLPPAGLLPVENAGFKASQFFGQALPVYSFDDPALMRSLIQQSFYQEPIKPGEPVSLYQLKDEKTPEPCLLFVRTAPDPKLVVQSAAPEPDSKATGSLYVTVVDRSGNAVKPGTVFSIEATNQKTKESFVQNKTHSWFNNAINNRAVYGEIERIGSLQDPYAGMTFVATSSYEVSVRKALAKMLDDKGNKKDADIADKKKQKGPVYRLLLPPGKYTVKANIGIRVDLVSSSASVDILAGQDTVSQLRLSPRIRQLPDTTGRIPTDFLDDYKVKPKFPVDSFVFNNNYQERFPNWQELTFGSETTPVVDPDLWQKIESLQLTIAAEEILSHQITDPAVASAEPELFIRKSYTPANPGDGFNAVIRTQDGSLFPFMAIPADHATGQSASVAKVPIPDFDRSTVMKLEAAGLSNLSVFASAPKELVAAVLGQSVEYSESLISDSLGSIKTDFQEGFLGFAGIDLAASNALKNAGIKKVDLANKTTAEVQQLLNDPAIPIPQGSRGNFANRLLLEVRQTLPPETFSVGTLDLSDQQKANLAGADIETIEQFNNKLQTPEGKTEVEQLLEIESAVLEETRRSAAVRKAIGEFETEPEKSVSTLEGVDDATAEVLSGAGITSSKDLSLLEASQLAEKAEISEVQASELIRAASGQSETVRVTLARELLGASVLDASASPESILAREDVASLGAIARVELSETSAVKPAQAILNKFITDKLNVRNIDLGTGLR